MRVTTRDNELVELELDEVFDFKTVDEFRSSYEGIETNTVRTIDINFGQTKYMDSSALGMLLNVQNYFKDKKISIRLINAKDQIKKILSISRFDQRFEIT